MDFSLVAESGGQSLVAVCRLLITVASLVEHGLQDMWVSVVSACGLRSCGSRALEHKPSSCGTRA